MLLMASIQCDHKDPVSASDADVKAIILFEGWDVFAAMDAAVIKEASIEKDRLRLRVEYSGGDVEHDFELYASKSFLESYPVQADLFLFHDAKGDGAEAIIFDELLFDLSPLKSYYIELYGGGGTLILRIHEPGMRSNFKMLLTYEF